MSSPTFAATHNLVAFLEKPAESNRFEQIIDFLNANPIKYALMVNPTVYSSCIKQFWATAKVKTVNGQDQLQALVDKKKVIIIEESIRRDLHFANEEGTDCLPNDTIFEELARMGAKTTTWNEFSSTMTSAIICLANNQKFNFSKYVLANMVKNLEGGVKFFMKFFANMRRQADGFSGVVTPLFETMMVQANAEVGDLTTTTHIPTIDQPSTSSRPQKKQKHRRKQRKEIASPQHESADEDHVPTFSSDPLPSGEDSSDLNELMVFYLSLQEQVLDLQQAKDAQAKEIANLKKISKSSLDIDSLGDQEDSSKQGRNEDNFVQDEALEQLYKEEMFGVDNLHVEIAAKSKKVEAITTAATLVTTIDVTRPKAKGIVSHEHEQTHRPTVSSIPPSLKDKGKAIMLAAEMEAYLEKEERERRQKEEEANLTLIELWESKKAMIEADRLLAERLQAREREELTIE
ncbi:hypothetical protein Tco_0367108 [Tanacetum coccineum]